MTHKQVEAYLADENNWHCVEAGNFLRLYTFDFKDIHVARIATYCCLNPWEKRLKSDAGLRYGWRFMDNYYEIEHGALGFQIAYSDLKRQVYDASKEAE